VQIHAVFPWTTFLSLSSVIGSPLAEPACPEPALKFVLQWETFLAKGKAHLISHNWLWNLYIS